MKTIYLINDEQNNVAIQLDFDTVTIMQNNIVISNTVFPTEEMAKESANNCYTLYTDFGYYKYKPIGVLLPPKRRKLNVHGDYSYA